MRQKIVAQNVIYADLSRRTASFFVDMLLINIVYAIFIFLLSFTNAIPAIHQFYTSYSKQSFLNTSTLPLTLEVEIGFSYILLYSLYVFAMLIIFGKTLGMFLFKIAMVGSDKDGNAISLSNPQIFSRGFFCSMLGFILAFITLIPWPFDKYKRSISDFIAETFVIQEDTNLIRTVVSYAVILLVVLLTTYSFFAG